MAKTGEDVSLLVDNFVGPLRRPLRKELIRQIVRAEIAEDKNRVTKEYSY